MSGTQQLYLGNGVEVGPATWSIYIDHVNRTATLYEGPDATGEIYSTKSLNETLSWYVRFITAVGTSAGFPAKDCRINLYDFSASATPDNGQVSVQVERNDGATSNVMPFTVTTPDTIYVDLANTSGIENGSMTYPFSIIQRGIDAANDGAKVVVADGTYTGDGNRDIDFMGKAITVRSQNGPETCIIDCQGTEAEPHRGFYFHNSEDGNSILGGFTIKNGYAMEGGGGMYNHNSNPSLMYCDFTSNFATYGAGMFNNLGSNPTISNCIFYRNSSATQGAGIFNHSGSSPIIENCTFVGNLGGTINGGRVLSDADSSPKLLNCILWNNEPDQIAGSSQGTTVRYCCIQDSWPGAGNIDVAPLFVNPNNDDYHLLPDSPCIDTGDPASDFGLEPEPDGGRINMGAYGNTPEATCKGGLILKSYNLVDKIRVGRTNFEYRYTVTLHNTSTLDVASISLEFMDAPANVTIYDPDVTFAYIGAGQTTTSEDTFAVRVDYSVTVDPSQISWQATFDWVGTVQSAQHISETTFVLEPKPGDIVIDNKVNMKDFARLAQHWLQNEPTVDIAPTPNGDGIVDLQDLLILVEYWLVGAETSN